MKISETMSRLDFLSMSSRCQHFSFWPFYVRIIGRLPNDLVVSFQTPRAKPTPPFYFIWRADNNPDSENFVMLSKIDKYRKESFANKLRLLITDLRSCDEPEILFCDHCPKILIFRLRCNHHAMSNILVQLHSQQNESWESLAAMLFKNK